MGMTMTQNMADVLAASYLGFEGAEPAVAKLSEAAVTKATEALELDGFVARDAQDGELYAVADAWDRLQAAQDRGEVTR
jgi:hypothetical protein